MAKRKWKPRLHWSGGDRVAYKDDEFFARIAKVCSSPEAWDVYTTSFTTTRISCGTYQEAVDVVNGLFALES